MKLHHRTKNTIFIGCLLTLFILTSCTSPLVLKTSKLLAQQSMELNQSLTVYQKGLEEDAIKRIDRLTSWRVENASMEHVLNERLSIWELSDRKEALKLYHGVQELIQTRIDAEMALAGKYEAEIKTLTETQLKYKSQLNALIALSQQLNELGKPMDRSEQLFFLMEFGNETRKRIEELQSENKNE